MGFTTIFTEVYAYREVLLNIISRDFKLKYKRTSLGYLWSLLNPVLQLVVLTAVFSHIVRLGMKDYTKYLFSGLLAWGFFQTSLVVGSVSFLENESFIKKIYLPKLIFPLSKICLRGIDFFFSLFALSLVGLVAGYSLHASVAAVPAAIVLLFLFTLGATVIVAVGTVYFRDMQYLLTVFLQLLYFATPILYPLTALPEKYHAYMRLNPMYSQVLIFQRLIYDGRMPDTSEWAMAAGYSIGLFVLGIFILRVTDEELVFRL